MNYFKTFIIIIIISLTARISSQNKVLQVALQKAGKNRSELQKVLDHYSKDSLKYKAACFLIENMDIHNSRGYYWANEQNKMVKFDELSYEDYESALIAFNKIKESTKLHPIVTNSPDIQKISSKYLINNIDRAFEIKNNPWTKYLSFEQFANFLLSYRILNEPYGDWRQLYFTKYSTYSNSLSNQPVRKVCTYLSDNLRKTFYNTYDLKNKQQLPAYLSPEQLLFRRQGTCEDMANWGVYLLRSIGIAAAIDFTPAWATSSGSHYWNVAFNENGDEIPFFMGDDNPEQFSMNREPSKVLRVTYESKSNVIANTISENLIPECFLRNKNYIDVTSNYWKTYNIRCQIDQKQKSQKIAFVTVFNNSKWTPVWWGKIINKQVNFSNMVCGVVYLPMHYNNNQLIPASYPTILNNNGSTKTLKPDESKKRTVKIYEQDGYILFRPHKKYMLLIWEGHWHKAGELTTQLNTKVLEFENIPSNILMLLVPEYSQGKERPFTINENGLREWW